MDGSQGQRYDLHRAQPTRSTPSRFGDSINGTRAVLGSGSYSGQKEKIRSRIVEKEDEGDRPQISGGGALLLNWDLRISSQRKSKE
jgi:hypothetical protein